MMMSRSRLFFLLGAIVLAAVWLGPLPGLARGSFSAHMTMHMVVVAFAAPLLALGIAGGRWDPVRLRPAWFPPVPLSFLELIAVWAWHAPQLHHAARGGAGALVFEQLIFLSCGLLLWLSALGGDPRQRADRSGAAIAALLLTSMHMTLLGALLALAPRSLYAHGAGSLQDQQLGGAIMLITGGLSYLTGGLALTFELLRGASARRQESKV